MQAVILAAGKGSRLMPLTADRHKCMLPLRGEPVLAYTLRILPKTVDEVILVVGYCKEKIIEHFGDAFNGKKLRYVEQAAPTGTTHALKKARPFLNDDYFFVLYADDLYGAEDLSRCVRGEPVVLVKRVPDPQRFGVCEITTDGYLKSIVEKPEHPTTDLANIGAYVLDHDIFDEPEIVVKGESYLAPQIGTLTKRRRVKVIEAAFWHPINRPEDYAAAEGALAAERKGFPRYS